jgi:phospholipid/cholesterol/gamma-HCH transport system substrate-binding protein
MESDARYAWVGVAVLVMVALLAGAIYWLKGGNDGHAMRRYVVYFKNQSLEGLQVNSDVRMQGIKVGKVEDYVILPNQAKTVRVLLKVDARTPILEGVEAVVTRNLVTGLAAVDLNNVWKGGTQLTTIPKGEEYVVIDEGVPGMARFTKNLEDLGSASQEFLGKLNRVLSEDNQRALSTTLNQVAGLAVDMRHQVGELAPQLSETLVAAQNAAVRLDAAGQEIGPLLRESAALAKHAGQRLDGLAGEAEATLQATRATLKNLDAGIDAVQVQLRLSADLGLQDIQNTAQILRMAGESLQTTSRDFADPGRILFRPNKGELGPGEQ